MKHWKLLTSLSVAFITLVISCQKIEKLSDYNEMSGFTIISHTSEIIEVGGVLRMIEISGTPIENDVIYIDIDFGEHLFPLSFQAEPVFQGTIDRIVGIDFSEELVLETSLSELTFYVMARSGLTRQYTIRPRITPLEKNVALSRYFKIIEQDPIDMLISEVGVTISLSEDDQRRDTLRIFTVAGTFPVTITPEFNIAELSDFGDITRPDGTTLPFENGKTSLRFDHAASAYNLTLISESGLANTWAIVMYHAPIVSGSDEESTPQEREGSDINPRTISASSQSAGFDVDEVFVDNNTEEILLVLKTKESFQFPLKINLSFEIQNGVQVFGLNGSATSTTLSFDSLDDVQTFYLLDIHSRVSRKWNIKLREWKSSENMVLAFDYDYTPSTLCTRWGIVSCAEEAPAIVLNTNVEKTIIRSRTNTVGDIFLYMTEVRNSTLPPLIPRTWQLTLNNLQVEVSDGATYQLPATLVWTGNESWREPRSFTVTAEDGSVKTWYVNIRDMREHTPSAEADLIGLTITRHVPNFVTFDDFYPVTIDREKNTATLKLTDDEGAYPLSVWFSAEVSPFAQVTSQHNGTEPLIFEHENSTQTITIEAEDGTEKQWTVGLQVPPREGWAEVLNFQVTSITGAQFAQMVINNETGVVRLWLTAPAAFPVEISYIMTISPRARAGIPLRGTFRFNSYQEFLSFVITAQDGTERNWDVRLANERQLTNWTLDQWTGNSPHGSWATANNFATTGTTPVAGNPATGSAAQLRTGSALGRVTSGSLFLGSFHFDVDGGLNDPVRLTHFGKPFETSGQILGIEFDAIYSPGREYNSDGSRELGSAVIELLKPKPGRENETWIYHGNRPDGTPHPNNTAVAVAHKQAVLGNRAGTSWNNLPVTIVSNTEWTRVQLLFDFPSGEKPDFTHIHIVFGSSAQGDAFRGVSGSTLRIDNVRILYKEDE